VAGAAGWNLTESVTVGNVVTGGSMTGRNGAALVSVRRSGNGTELRGCEERLRAPLAVRHHAVIRTRFFDDHLLDATARGIRQVILLAAGLDTRAYRLR